MNFSEDKVNVKEIEKYLKATREGKMICRNCGRINPKCGFYPQISYSTGDISGFLCLDCDKEMRIK